MTIPFSSFRRASLTAAMALGMLAASLSVLPAHAAAYADGTVLKTSDTNRTYVMQHGTRRELRGDAAIAASGGAGAAVTVTQAAINAIPRTMLVRAQGTAAIYLINEQNYARKILNPTVFTAYKFRHEDVVDIPGAEFATYPINDLVIRPGDNRVYQLSTKSLIGSFASLPSKGYKLEEVHLVNDVDFNAYSMNVVAQGLAVPWDIVFLPGGDMLVTERPGTLRRIGSQNTVIDLPSVHHVGEGGLMGMALHPDFAQNGYVYLYFTTLDDGGKKNRVSRFRLEGNHMIDEFVIADGIPASLYHDGGQLAFGPDGMLYVTTGDAEIPALAQDKGSLAGKTLRYTPEGTVPSDNPFGTPVWSYGHRNAQGIAWDSQGRQWQTEHGRTGGGLSGYDELNLIEKGKNYGWPTMQGDATASGMTPPVRHSGASTTWAPSGMAYKDGVLYFAGLRGSALYAATVTEDGTVSEFRTLLQNTYGRLRAVVNAPDGSLYITTSNRDSRGTPRSGDDKIIRVFPGMFR